MKKLLVATAMVAIFVCGSVSIAAEKQILSGQTRNLIGSDPATWSPTQDSDQDILSGATKPSFGLSRNKYRLVKEGMMSKAYGDIATIGSVKVSPRARLRGSLEKNAIYNIVQNTQLGAGEGYVIVSGNKCSAGTNLVGKVRGNTELSNHVLCEEVPAMPSAAEVSSNW